MMDRAASAVHHAFFDCASVFAQKARPAHKL